MTRSLISRRDLLGIVGYAGVGLACRPVVAQEDRRPPKINYGWDPEVEGPTDANFHVAPRGNDNFSGTRDMPLRSVQAGVNLLAAHGSGSLAIHAGIYREEVSLDALRGQPNPQGEPKFRIHRFGKDRVTITAAEPLLDWRLAQEADVAPLGISKTGVYVRDIARTKLLHDDPFALNLHEDGAPCALARRAAQNAVPERIFDQNQFLRGVFATEGERQIIRAISAEELIGAKPSQALQAKFLVYAAPNVVLTIEPQRFDPASGTAYFADTPELRLQVVGSVPQMLFAVQNLPTHLAPGEWAFRVMGTNIRIFFNPRNADRLDQSIEISVRERCLNFGQASSVELFGIEAVRASGSGRLGGVCIMGSSEQVRDRLSDIRLLHCRAGESFCASGNGYGAIFFMDHRGLKFNSCSIGPTQGSFGIFLSRCAFADLRYLHVSGVSKSPCRFFGLRRAVFAFSLLQECGWDAHANKFNFYQGSDLVLVYGIRTQNTGGYATYQRASRIFFGFCELDCDPSSQNRALVSQNLDMGRVRDREGGTGELTSGGTFWYWNLSLLPRLRHSEQANALSLGPKGSTQRHAFHNCLLHGGGVGAIYTRNAPAEMEQRSHNLYSGLAHWQNARYGWSLGHQEEMMTLQNSLAMRGLDMRTVIQNEIAPFFPEFDDWDHDIDGNEVDWSLPPIGAQV